MMNIRNFPEGRNMKNMIFFVILGIFTHNIYSQTLADANAAAMDAVRRLEQALDGNPTAGPAFGAQSAALPPAQVTRGGRRPNWINDINTAYDRNYFIARIGEAPGREQAEARALTALISYFGETIQYEFTVVENYTEAVNRGVVNISQNTNTRELITRAASMDRLIGAEIGNVWDSGKGTVYAAAFMDKAKAISIYTDLITVNNRHINLLTAMSNTEKNTLDGYARYRLAAQIAGINANYSAVITGLGGSVASLNLRSADSFNLEAANIIRNITAAVRVNNDRANRVQDAFAGVLSSAGLRTRGNNPLYTLEVRLNVSEVTFPGNRHIFCSIEVSANLIENSTGASLFPFSFNLREGHTTYANAEARAFRSAEREIAEKYPALFKEYLASLLPQ